MCQSWSSYSIKGQWGSEERQENGKRNRERRGERRGRRTREGQRGRVRGEQNHHPTIPMKWTACSSPYRPQSLAPSSTLWRVTTLHNATTQGTRAFGVHFHMGLWGTFWMQAITYPLNWSWFWCVLEYHSSILITTATSGPVQKSPGFSPHPLPINLSSHLSSCFLSHTGFCQSFAHWLKAKVEDFFFSQKFLYIKDDSPAPSPRLPGQNFWKRGNALVMKWWCDAKRKQNL